MFQFYDLSLVQARLTGTVIKVAGVYRYITEVHYDRRNSGFLGVDETGDAYVLTPLTVDYTNMNIGMLEYPRTNEIFWTSRLPVRRWKVGLNRGNLTYRPLSTKPTGYRMFDGAMFNTALPGIYRMLNKEYPRKSVVLTAGTGILSRRYALVKGSLYRKSIKIGSLANEKFVLLDQFKHFQEEMEEECTDKLENTANR